MTTDPVDWHERLFTALRNALEDDGWSIEDASNENAINFHLEHELTSGYSVGIVREDRSRDHSAYIRDILAQREFEQIRRRPAEVPHAPLVRQIRVSAQVFDWDSGVVAIVARILTGHGVITADEATWLEEAGPAWSE